MVHYAARPIYSLVFYSLLFAKHLFISGPFNCIIQMFLQRPPDLLKSEWNGLEPRVQLRGHLFLKYLKPPIFEN